MLCLAGAAFQVALGVSALTLAWTHSVQKTRWEEDWQADGVRLVVTESRVEASGAGMDPPEGSRFDGRFWRWRPAVGPLASISLRRSGATADWQICRAGRCATLESLLPVADADPVVLAVCAPGK